MVLVVSVTGLEGLDLRGRSGFLPGGYDGLCRPHSVVEEHAAPSSLTLPESEPRPGC